MRVSIVVSLFLSSCVLVQTTTIRGRELIGTKLHGSEFYQDDQENWLKIDSVRFGLKNAKKVESVDDVGDYLEEVEEMDKVVAVVYDWITKETYLCSEIDVDDTDDSVHREKVTTYIKMDSPVKRSDETLPAMSTAPLPEPSLVPLYSSEEIARTRESIAALTSAFPKFEDFVDSVASEFMKSLSLEGVTREDIHVLTEAFLRDEGSTLTQSLIVQNDSIERVVKTCADKMLEAIVTKEYRKFHDRVTTVLDKVEARLAAIEVPKQEKDGSDVSEASHHSEESGVNEEDVRASVAEPAAQSVYRRVKGVDSLPPVTRRNA